MSTKESADSSYENCAADKRCRSDVQPLFGGSCPLLRARSVLLLPTSRRAQREDQSRERPPSRQIDGNSLVPRSAAIQPARWRGQGRETPQACKLLARRVVLPH